MIIDVMFLAIHTQREDQKEKANRMKKDMKRINFSLLYNYWLLGYKFPTDTTKVIYATFTKVELNPTNFLNICFIMLVKINQIKKIVVVIEKKQYCHPNCILTYINHGKPPLNFYVLNLFRESIRFFIFILIITINMYPSKFYNTCANIVSNLYIRMSTLFISLFDTRL